MYKTTDNKPLDTQLPVADKLTTEIIQLKEKNFNLNRKSLGENFNKITKIFEFLLSSLEEEVRNKKLNYSEGNLAKQAYYFQSLMSKLQNITYSFAAICRSYAIINKQNESENKQSGEVEKLVEIMLEGMDFNSSHSNNKKKKT